MRDCGQDFAAAIWVVDPTFMLDLVHEQLNDGDTSPVREEARFAGARIDHAELHDDAAVDEQQRRAQARARRAEATGSNLVLGHDVRAGLIAALHQEAAAAAAYARSLSEAARYLPAGAVTATDEQP